jgi:hypothetical protein
LLWTALQDAPPLGSACGTVSRPQKEEDREERRTTPGILRRAV